MSAPHWHCRFPAFQEEPMFERLNQIEARYEELTQALASPEID